MRCNFRPCLPFVRWLPASLFAALFLSLALSLALPGQVTAAECQNAITVANTADSGPGSLRQAISDLCPDGVIDFDPVLTAGSPATIALTSGELGITKNMTINGPGADLLAVSGNNATRIFHIGSGAANVTIDGLTIRNGNGSNGSGGGIYNVGALTVTNSALLDNSITGTNRGGALYNSNIDNQGQVTLINSIVANNSSEEHGGGIYTTGTGLVAITNTTFYSNTGDMGGALSTSYGYATVTNSTFSGNSASTAGAAIRTSMGAITLTNTIIENSLGSSNCAINPLTDFGGNIADDSSCDFTAATSLNSTDPLLAPLANYGGSTPTMALLPGSPAIDFGVWANCPERDQRGEYRFAGASCDSGAFEAQGFQLDITSGTPQAASVFSAFAQPLQVTVSSAVGEPVGPSGFVTFTPPSEGPGLSVTEPFTAATDANGLASSGIITANAISGSYSVTPTVHGEGFNPTILGDAPPPAVFALANERIVPAISLDSNPNPSRFTELVVLSVDVSTDVLGANTPSGIISFTADGDFLGAETLNAWGEASLYINDLPVGSHSIVAEYSGDDSFQNGASTPLDQTVNPVPTETTLQIKPNPALYGDNVLFGVAVQMDVPEPSMLVSRPAPSGHVVITDASGTIALGGWVVNGRAILSGGIIPAGTYDVIATFAGDENFTESTSQPVTLVVEKHATTTALTSSSNPTFVDAPICFTTVVSEVQPDYVRALGLAAPTGAAVIADTTGAINLGGSLSNGSAQLCAPQLAAGTYTVTATYLGNERHAGSVSTQLIQVVEQHATATELELTPSQVQVGETFHLLATVSNMELAALINGGPVGTVEFLADGNPLGSATLSNSQAALSLPAPTAGVFTLTARYLGNSIYAPSSSDAVQLTVVKRPTTTTVTAAPNPSKQREPVLFTATVAEQQASELGAEALRPMPAGAVIFAADGAEFGRASLVDGVATLSYAQLPVGTITITAKYVGDNMFADSQSAAHQQTVLPMPLAVNDAAGAQEQPITIAVTANDLDPAGGGLTVVSVSAPAHGSATVAPDRPDVIYTPAAGYSGLDSFTYVIEDVNGNRDQALVFVVNTLAVDGQDKPQVHPTDPTAGSSAVFTTTTAVTVTVQMPAGFFTGTLAEKDVLFISFTPVITPSEQTDTPPANLKFGNLEYTLEVFLNGQLLTGQSFAVPLAVTINYDPAVLGSLKPETLGLWYWDGAAWSTDGITLINNDVANHTVTVSMTHFSQYAFFAAAPTGLDPSEEPQGAFRVYLPTINQ